MIITAITWNQFKSLSNISLTRTFCANFPLCKESTTTHTGRSLPGAADAAERECQNVVNGDIKQALRRVTYLKDIKMSMPIIIFIYILLAMLIAASSYLAIAMYAKGRTVRLPSVEPLTMDSLTADCPVEFVEDTVRFTISKSQFDGLTASAIESMSKTERDSTIKAMALDPNNNTAYINAADKNGQLYSFVCDTYIDSIDSGLLVIIDEVRIGSSELIGNKYWSDMSLPDEIEIPLEHPYMTDTSVKFGNDETVEITYHYDYTQMQAMLDGYIGNVDEVKASVSSSQFVDLVKAKDVKQIVNHFGGGGFREFLYLLTDEAINTAYNDLAFLYERVVPVDKIVEASNGEVDGAFASYHLAFSKSLLQYLYNNKQYTSVQGNLYVNGAPFDAANVIIDSDANSFPVTLLMDSANILAKYTVRDRELIKTIIGE